MKTAFIALLVLSTTTAHAAGLDGTWSIPAAGMCEKNPVTTDGVIRIDGKKFEMVESGCTTKKIETRNGIDTFKLSCSWGDDPNWTAEVRMARAGDDALVSIGGDEWVRYTRCP